MLYESVASKLAVRGAALAEFVQNADLESYWNLAVKQARADSVEVILWSIILALVATVFLIASKNIGFE